MLCPGFVQIDKNIFLGIRVSPMSSYEGPQFELSFSISQVRNLHIHENDHQLCLPSQALLDDFQCCTYLFIYKDTHKHMSISCEIDK